MWGIPPIFKPQGKIIKAPLGFSGGYNQTQLVYYCRLSTEVCTCSVKQSKLRKHSLPMQSKVERTREHVFIRISISNNTP
jgi:hypothetical protein